MIIDHSGSFVAILGLPLAALVARNDIVTVITSIHALGEVKLNTSGQCDAWIVVVGSSGSLATTIAFIYVLAKFPGFLRHIKSEGAEAAIVLQLHTFYRLNVRPSTHHTFLR